MRAVVQRVLSASVEVDGRTVSEIGPGLLVLVGLHESDVESDADFICRKVLNMRIFPNDSTGKSWDQNVMQKKYGVLLVSQFTLFGILKGNKPDFHVSMPSNKAKPFYELLVDKFRKSYDPDAIQGKRIVMHNDNHHKERPDLEASPHSYSSFTRREFLLSNQSIKETDGVFGAMMKVHLVNDGPVTMQLDSSQASKNSTSEAGEEALES